MVAVGGPGPGAPTRGHKRLYVADLSLVCVLTLAHSAGVYSTPPKLIFSSGAARTTTLRTERVAGRADTAARRPERMVRAILAVGCEDVEKGVEGGVLCVDDCD